nr:hypothetical protein [Tanacetum cinerariifolium]
MADLKFRVLLSYLKLSLRSFIDRVWKLVDTSYRVMWDTAYWGFLRGEGHMARKCTKPKRPKNSAWFKEKMLLVQAHESSQVLSEEQLPFLTDDLDAYDSDCDDISLAKVVPMANILSYNSDVLFEVVQIVLWYLDSGCSKHMTRKCSQLINFVHKFLEAVETAGFTQNRSLIRKRHNKTPYELLHNKKPDLSYFYVFGALCYPTNVSEDLGKLKSKADIGIFVGYAPAKKASGPRIQLMTPRTLSLRLVPKHPLPTPYVPPTKKDWDTLFQPMFDEYFNPPPSIASLVPIIAALVPADSTVVPNPPPPTLYVPPTKKDWNTLFQPMFDEYFNPPPSVSSLVPAVPAPVPID